MVKNNRALQFAIIVTLVLRIFTSLVMYAATKGTSIETCLDFPCNEQVNQQLNSSGFGKYFLAPWYRWDAVHYLDKADPGYQVFGLENTVWPPLYSWLIQLISPLIPGMAAALLISTLACGIFFYLLFSEVLARWDEIIACRTVLLTAFFPTGFFLMAGYSEAEFLALSLGVFVYLRKQKYWLAGVLGALAVLTRLQGVFLVIPFIWEILRYSRRQWAGQKNFALLQWMVTDKKIRQLAAAAAFILFAMVLYFCCVHYLQGAAWPWNSLSTRWGRQLSWPGLGFINNIRYLFLHLFRLVDSMLIYDALLLLILLVALATQWRRLPIGWSMYGVVMLVFPSLFLSGEGGTMTSVSRYVLAVFPAFVALENVLHHRIGYLFWLTFSISSQAFMMMMFTRWMWVA